MNPNYSWALSNPSWCAAMKQEYATLMKNNTWSIIELTLDKLIVGSMWIFKVKQHPDGFVQKLKAAWYKKVHSKARFWLYKNIQSRHWASYNAYNSHCSSRLWLAHPSGWQWQCFSLWQPQGFEHPNKNLVCKLHKSLWFQTSPLGLVWKANNYLVYPWFISSKCDSSLFIKHSSTHTIYVLDMWMIW